MATRYDIKPDPNGWTVYDTTTHLPAEVNGFIQVGLSTDDADDLASSNSSIAGTGQPFLPAFPPALVGRASEAGITRYGPSVAHVSRQHLVHQHVGRLDADPDHARQ